MLGEAFNLIGVVKSRDRSYNFGTITKTKYYYYAARLLTWVLPIVLPLGLGASILIPDSVKKFSHVFALHNRGVDVKLFLLLDTTVVCIMTCCFMNQKYYGFSIRITIIELYKLTLQ